MCLVANSTGYIEMRTHVQFCICVYILVCPVELATGHKSNPKNKKGKSNIITKKEKKRKKKEEDKGDRKRVKSEHGYLQHVYFWRK